MDYSRDIQCNNIQGGASKLYVLPYVDYLDSQISIENNILTLFPYSVIYDLNAFNITYSNDVKQDVDNLCDISISFQLKKLNESDIFIEYIKRDYRIIIKDNNNKIRIFGLFNGLTVGYKEDIGSNKNEFNGYSFTFQGKEEFIPPYLLNLDNFDINGLISLQQELQYSL